MMSRGVIQKHVGTHPLREPYFKDAAMLVKGVGLEDGSDTPLGASLA